MVGFAIDARKLDIEQNCKINKNKLPNVSSIKFDSCYMLFKGANGVKAKFIGTPIVGPKKKAIWVPKTLATNLQGPKQVWVPKRFDLLFVDIEFSSRAEDTHSKPEGSARWSCRST